MLTLCAFLYAFSELSSVFGEILIELRNKKSPADRKKLISQQNMNNESMLKALNDDGTDIEYCSRTLIKIEEPEDTTHVEDVVFSNKIYIKGHKIKHNKTMQPNPCLKGCVNKCAEEFTEDERMQIFNYYWELPDHDAQRDFISNCITNVPTKRRYCKLKEKQRQRKQYTLCVKGKTRICCQIFLIKTLDVSQKLLRYTYESWSAIGKTMEKPKIEADERITKEEEENRKRIKEEPESTMEEGDYMDELKIEENATQEQERDPSDEFANGKTMEKQKIEADERLAKEEEEENRKRIKEELASTMEEGKYMDELGNEEKTTQEQERDPSDEFPEYMHHVVPTLQPNPCLKGCVNRCTTFFTEQNRREVFEYYWNLPDYASQRNFISSCIRNIPTKKIYTKIKDKQRSRNQYTLPWHNQTKVVCQIFLLRTLNISQNLFNTRSIARKGQGRNSNHSIQRGDNIGDVDTSSDEENEEIQRLRIMQHEYKSLQPNPCPNKCPNNCSQKFTEEDRRNIFTYYWNLTDDMRKEYISKCISEFTNHKSREVKRQRRRRQYSLLLGNKRRVVCQIFIIKTLDVSQARFKWPMENKRVKIKAVRCAISKQTKIKAENALEETESTQENDSLDKADLGHEIKMEDEEIIIKEEPVKTTTCKLVQTNHCPRRCKNGCSNNFTQEDRKEIFTRYWNLADTDERKDLFSKHIRVISSEPQTPSTSRFSLRRLFSILVGNERKVCCQSFITNMLGISSILFKSLLYKSVQPNPCGKGCVNNCSTRFTEGDRRDIFTRYWSLPDCEKQKEFVSNCIRLRNIPSYKTSRNKRRREFSLLVGNERRICCHIFIMKTLDVSSTIFKSPIENKLEVVQEEIMNGQRQMDIEVGKESTESNWKNQILDGDSDSDYPRKTTGVLDYVATCPNRCVNNCSKKFTEEDRTNIYAYYWGLADSEKQREFLTNCTTEIESDHQGRKRREFSLPHGNGRKVCCQIFIIKTLDIYAGQLRFLKKDIKQEVNVEIKIEAEEPTITKSYIVTETSDTAESITDIAVTCPNTCLNNCSKKFTEEDRENIYAYYWGLADSEKQREFLTNCTAEISDHEGRKLREFSLPHGNGREVCCQIFLIKTLDIYASQFKFLNKDEKEEVNIEIKIEAEEPTIEKAYFATETSSPAESITGEAMVKVEVE